MARSSRPEGARRAFWGIDEDTWIAGLTVRTRWAGPVRGRRRLDAQRVLVQFSSGTDHRDWIFPGRPRHRPGSANSGPAPQMMHFILPRADYEIVDGSWEVVGLAAPAARTSASVTSTFPAYRAVVIADAVIDGRARPRRGPDSNCCCTGCRGRQSSRLADHSRRSSGYARAASPPASTTSEAGPADGRRRRSRQSARLAFRRKVHAARCQLLAQRQRRCSTWPAAAGRIPDDVCAHRASPATRPGAAGARSKRWDRSASWRRCGGNSIRLDQPGAAVLAPRARGPRTTRSTRRGRCTGTTSSPSWASRCPRTPSSDRARAGRPRPDPAATCSSARPDDRGREPPRLELLDN